MTTKAQNKSAPAETEAPEVTLRHHDNKQSYYIPDIAARLWLSRGFDVLPIQPNSKRIFSGFGQYQNRLRTIAECVHWFGNEHTKNNMAVVCNGEDFIIDFDSFELYAAWAKVADEKFTLSYTEYSPRGVHVFLCGPLPAGLKLISGVEIKRVCLVAPSVVNGVSYESGFGEIFPGELTNCFSSLSALFSPSAAATSPAVARPHNQNDLIADIKSRVLCADVLWKFAPKTYESLRGAGRFRSARCPFHKAGMEVKHSFWIDTELNLWGCHAESIRGDVINLYAKLTGKTNTEAIKDLLFSSTMAGPIRGPK